MVAAEPPKNLMRSLFYDPSHDDYDPDLFYSEQHEAYCCPFQACAVDDVKFDAQSDLEGHLHHAHMRVNFVCPTCFKRFTSATAHVAHIESTTKCRVKDSNNFKKVNYAHPCAPSGLTNTT